MASVHPNISPKGLDQKYLVKFFYAAVESLRLLTAKLDDDTGTGLLLTTYEANCYTNIIEHVIYDHRGNRTGRTGKYIITPNGISDAAILELLYDLTNAIETLTEQLDSETLSGYEAACYTAMFLHMVESQYHTTILGNGNSFYFRPGGVIEQKQLVDWMYNYMNAWETLCEALDGEGAAVTYAAYEASYYTAYFTFRVENSAGNVLGHDTKDM